MHIILENWRLIAQGLSMTLALAGAVLLCTTVISLALGVLATLPNRWVRAAIHGYVELFRSIPLIVNVFCVFFVAPMFGLDLSPFVAATVGLSLWGGANGAVVVSGGILSVPPHQWKSAAALGLRRWQIYRYVIGPQSVGAILPAYTGLLTLLVQSTSLGALIGVSEFLKVNQNIIERVTVMQGRNPAFEIYGLVLIVYFIVCSALSALSRHLERRLQREPVRSLPQQG
ncbi:amino acid ABC transporter permease [Pandoraea sp. ISTKB]|uniref:amino acid ABC transporter permease n=1 Tax=Pandoraea sp. ISTKB TaxID=1586708 RepID=UPI000846716F|nr:amino acid ABC transporter permease [Pandoraea sp. ISTKB]ODP35418.1 amino acid ABC transporter permease [Pandoraea sp. ISTKB]